MSTHGVGSYTSRAISKRWTRQDELLADATEKASVMAEWLGGAPYQNSSLIQHGNVSYGINSMMT